MNDTVKLQIVTYRLLSTIYLLYLVAPYLSLSLRASALKTFSCNDSNDRAQVQSGRAGHDCLSNAAV
jgi:hypothetical protein